MPTVISSVCWVPKGVAQSNPDRLKLDDTQIQELMQQQQDDSMDDVTEDTQGTATAGGNVVYLSSRWYRALNLERYQIVRFLVNHTILSCEILFSMKDQEFCSNNGLKIVWVESSVDTYWYDLANLLDPPNYLLQWNLLRWGRKYHIIPHSMAGFGLVVCYTILGSLFTLESLSFH